MKISEFEKIINEFAPTSLKESFDNVGLMVGESDKEITNILVALDCTLEVINEAIENNCNLIFTHHPLLFRKPSSITDRTLQGKKILKLIQNNIALYSAHTNLDAVEGGINDTIVEILGFGKGEILDRNENAKKINVNGGIGRLIALDKEITLKDILSIVKNKLNIQDLRYAGDLNKIIRKAAIINGSGQDFFEISKSKNADLIITGDTTYHFVSDYNEEDIAIVDIGHFSSEFAPLIKVSNDIMKILSGNNFNGEMLVAKTSKNPFNIF